MILSSKPHDRGRPWEAFFFVGEDGPPQRRCAWVGRCHISPISRPSFCEDSGKILPSNPELESTGEAERGAGSREGATGRGNATQVPG